MSQFKVMYYAHCMDIYDTKQEERDIELILRMGYLAENPNGEANKAAFQSFRELVGNQYMMFFNNLIDKCQALCFRALPSGAIPAGVYAEIQHALSMNIPVIELPSFSHRQLLNVEQTRQYLSEAGQR